MKIEQLRLLAFGTFSDFEIDFAKEGPGLHIVYGPNEAGKSTTLRALIDVLYGFPHRSPDAHRFSYASMRLGARLTRQSGESIGFVRRKGKQPLRCVDDSQVVNEEQLEPYLAGVDRGLFLSLFAIDHERLIEGGQNILKGEGRLGEMLFEAGSGLNNIQTLLKQLQAKSDALFKPTGKNPTINKRLSEFKEAQDKARLSQLVPDDYHTLVASLDNHQAERESLDSQLATLETKVSQGQRLQSALPLLSKRNTILAQLSNEDRSRLLSVEDCESIRSLLDSLSSTRIRIDDLDRRLTRLTSDEQSIELDSVILEQREAIDQLRERLGQFRADQEERPSRHAEIEKDESRIRELLHEIGRDPSLEIEGLESIPARQVVRIQDLGRDYERLTEQVRQSEAAQAKLQQELDRSRASLTSIAVPPEDLNLAWELQQLESYRRKSDDMAELQRELESCEQKLSDHRRSLDEMPISASDIRQLDLPSNADVESFIETFAEIDSQISQLEKERSNLELALAELQGQVELVESVDELPSETKLVELRGERDSQLQRIRSELERKELRKDQIEEAASQLEDLHSELDRLSDRLRHEADRVAHRRGLHQQLAGQKAKLERLQQEAKQLQERKEAREAAWLELWSNVSKAPKSPKAMPSWLMTAHAVADLLDHRDRLREKADTLQGEMTEIVQRGETILSDAQSTESMTQQPHDAIVDATSQRLLAWQESLREREQAERNVVRIEEELALNQVTRQQAAGELESWQLDWTREMQGLDMEPSTRPAEANSVMGHLGELANVRRTLRENNRHLNRIDENLKQFASDVCAMARKVEIPELEVGAKSTVELVLELGKQSEAALANDREVRRLRQDQQSVTEELESLRLEENQQVARLQQLTRLIGDVTEAQLPQILNEQRDQRDLVGRLEVIEDQLAGLSAGLPVSEFVEQLQAELERVDRIDSELDQARQEIKQLRESRDNCLRLIDRDSLKLASMNGDETAARLAEEAEQIGSRLKEEIHELAINRLMESVLTQAIQRFREKYENPLLKEAASFFRRLTCGAFEQLLIDISGDGVPILLAKRSGGNGSVRVEEMSDGTRDQLYLAFRLACLILRLEHRESVPFIVDDVLMTFDDERATAGLETLQQFSTSNQVIMFTHHSHLVELAKSKLEKGTFQLHYLSDVK